MRVLVIGAGLSGATVARLHSERGDEVLVCEQQDRVGGMCADEPYQTWYEPLYGPHFFHTNNREVWDFLSRFTAWVPYEHRVLAAVNDKLVPIPVNIDTVNVLFDAGIEDEGQMQAWLAHEVASSVRAIATRAENSEEVALQRVGRRLYELLFEPYTVKQWGRHPRELPPEIMARIPVRLNHEDRYFTDQYQGIPKDGYTRMIERMLEGATVFRGEAIDTHTRAPGSYATFAALFGNPVDRVYYTGRIDGYWEESELEYRSVLFQREADLLRRPAVTVNYPSHDVGYTRKTEMRLAYGGEPQVLEAHAPNGSTVRSYFSGPVLVEYPVSMGPAYYPVPTADNLAKYAEYQRRAAELEKRGIYMVGRLATYKYLNMDQAVRAAMDLVRRLP